MKKLLSLVAILIVATGMALGQSQNGSIAGVITDSTGAVVAGATITVTNIATGAVRSTTTTSSGAYDIEGLPPQEYTVTVTAAGFAPTTTSKFNVSVGSSNTVNAKISVKADSAVVDVAANSTAGINLENAENSQVINSVEVVDLPSLTRNPYDFVAISGFAVQDVNGSNRGAGVALGGARSASTEILLDGLENTQLFSVGVATQTPVDSVQEFRVISSNYGPQYGRASGGVVNVATKQGTNNFHGTTWEFYRPSTFVSADSFNKANGLKQGRFVRNEFGFVVGGPIIKDKLFFFGGNEWLRVRSSQPSLFVVPTSQFIGLSNTNTQNFFSQYGTLVATPVGNPYTLCQIANGSYNPATGQGTGGGCAGGAVVSSAFDTQYTTGTATPSLSDRQRLEAITGFSENTPIFQLVQTTAFADAGGGAPQNTYNPIGRIDFNMTNKTTMYGRYILYNSERPVGAGNISPYQGYNTPTTVKSQNLIYGLTHIFNNQWTSQVQLGLLRVNVNSPLGARPLGPTLFLNSTSFQINNPVVFPGYNATSASNGLPSGGPQNNIMVSPVFTYNKGRHTVTFGGQYTYIRDNHTFAIYSNAQEALVSTGGGSNGALVNFQAGQFDYFQANIDSQGKFPCVKSLTTGQQVVTAACTVSTPISQPAFGRSNRYQEAAGFVNDTFKVNSRLTLNAGLRYELYGTQHNKNPNLDSNFYFGTSGTIFDRVRNGQILRVTDTAPAGVQNPGGKLWNTNYKQFAPRVSFALDLTGDGKTSLRGGYGISYERNFGNVTYNVSLNPPGEFAISITNVDNGGSSSNPFSATFPISTGTLGPFSAGGLSKALPQATVRAVDPKIKPAYAQFYTLGLERQVTNSFSLGVAFQGARGIHNYSISNYNRLFYGQVYENDPATYAAPGSGTNTNRLQPQYTSINVRGADGDSYYNAVNVSARASNLMHTGLTFLSNYTYGHSQDNLTNTFASDSGSNGTQVGGVAYFDPFNKALDYGNADNDVKHRIAMGIVYVTNPYGANEIVRQATGGWEIGTQYTAQTGQPYSIYDSAMNTSSTTVTPRARFLYRVAHERTRTSTAVAGSPGYYNYMDLAPRGVVSAANTNYGYYRDAKGGQPDLPTIIGAPGLGDTFTNAGSTGMLSQRNSFRGPGFQSFNADVIKRFKYKERYGLELRAELYNVLNHQNEFLNPGSGTDVNKKSYIQTYRDGQRQLQLAGKITF